VTGGGAGSSGAELDDGGQFAFWEVVGDDGNFLQKGSLGLFDIEKCCRGRVIVWMHPGAPLGQVADAYGCVRMHRRWWSHWWFLQQDGRAN